VIKELIGIGILATVNQTVSREAAADVARKLGAEVREAPASAAVEEAAAPAAERWRVFEKEMNKCSLCFACRNLCPACYCASCFTESSQPKWMSKTADEGDVMFFHLARLMHLTGRCTGCGACERGCPMKVNLRLYNDRLRKDVKEVFDFEAGADPQAKPPLTCYQMGDKNDFIM
jgi:ferredoxin